jgi:hypothetical protein
VSKAPEALKEPPIASVPLLLCPVPPWKPPVVFHENAKAELKVLMPEDAKEGLCRGARDAESETVYDRRQSGGPPAR